MLRLLLDGDCLAVVVELHDAEPLRIVHIVAEHRSPLAGLRVLHRRLQPLLQAVAGENIVSQHHGHRVVADELLADDEGLGQAVRAWLYGIGKIHAKLMAIP